MTHYFFRQAPMNKIYKYFFTVLAIIAAFNASAQIATTIAAPVAKTAPIEYVKSYVGIFGGISSPLSDFKSLDYNNNKSGFAKRGAAFGIDGAVYVYKNIAVAGNIAFQDQGQLTQDDANALATGYTESFKSDQATVTTVGRYHSYTFLLGPQYSIPFYKGFIVDLRVSGGLLATRSAPETTTTLSGTPTQTATFYQYAGKGSAFAYGASAALRYKLGDGVSVVLRGNYVQSEGPAVLNNARTVTTTGRYLTRQPFNVFQTTLGFNFMF